MGPSINTTDEHGSPIAVQAPAPASASSPKSPKTNAVASSSKAVISGDGTSQKLRVRRSTFVPGWAVPPRVLLVDDDAISRKLSSKFLQVFGCTTDVAVDGVSAVTKMNLEKYDLVLMDIVMPKLDGVSATNMIRKFDQGSPIIAMTSNSKPNEIMTYYSSGMNDILPKPFSKQGLFDMLEKHLTHLKNMQQMSRNIPRGPGIPPLSDLNFEQALMQNASPGQLSLSGPSSSSQLSMQPQASSSSSGQGPSNPDENNASNSGIRAPSPFNMSNFFSLGPDQGDEGRINPLAGMGLTDEQYSMMLANIVNGDNFMGGLDVSGSNSSASSPGGMFGMGMGSGSGVKRGYDDVGGPDLEGPQKKSRFEVIE
ncbi:hypothetical protein NMY22_g19302 [Coprinellus aureogranulatus]|nr:hypothetical protein NMY22_g19302 [Coprinellus aureogranulatus]